MAQFPRQAARTRNFTLGQPRGFTVAPGGERVAFLRSLAGDDPVNRLWVLDLDPLEGAGPSGRERLVADPAALLAASGGHAGAEALPAEERARRERARERAGGIVAYATDRAVRLAAFALAGRLFVADLSGKGDGAVRELPVAGPVVDPRPDPHGRRVAYVRGGALYVTDLHPDGGEPAERRVAGPGDEEDPAMVSWGLAEFVAAEEMGRDRGFWWSPDGRRLAVARVDTSPVGRFWLADPAQPAVAPASLPYPVAGTANADVRLFVVGAGPGDGGPPVEVVWERDALPYLAAVTWDWEAAGPLTLLVQSRDQRRAVVLAADPDSGATRQLAEATDPAWVELVPGVPAWLEGGHLVGTADDPACDTRRLTVDGVAVTPPGLQVQEVLAAGGQQVLLAGSEAGAPAEVHLWRWRRPGPGPGRAGLERLTGQPGVHNGTAAGPLTVIARSALDQDGSSTTVHRDGPGGTRTAATLRCLAEPPPLRPRVCLERLGARGLWAALLLPSWHTEADGPLPVLLDPYGGPHARRVLASRGAFLTSQWFAEQGFAVLVCDGRGTPGRGPAWEKAVHGDLAGPILEDQVDALHAAAAAHRELDLGRVAIRGWSFGGFLAALAVLRRPDVFHAAVAGAPVTDWRLYDTHYTERYLGDPAADPERYQRSSLLADAGRLERPLLLIHGLADDNVVAAHTLRLSSLLLAAGRPHSVLPLTGVTHLAVQEAVAENLLRLQLAFLRQALGL